MNNSQLINRPKATLIKDAYKTACLPMPSLEDRRSITFKNLSHGLVSVMAPNGRFCISTIEAFDYDFNSMTDADLSAAYKKAFTRAKKDKILIEYAIRKRLKLKLNYDIV